MSEDKIIFVNDETYKLIIEKLGYIPSNLVPNKFFPKDQAFLVDDTQLNFPRRNYSGLNRTI